jgi:hypothetical protein
MLGSDWMPGAPGLVFETWENWTRRSIHVRPKPSSLTPTPNKIEAPEP